jgi:hypothetical protein
VYIQQDATLHSLFISGNCSTCFGWYHHPSSGAHTTVSTASGICHTLTAIWRYRGRVGTGLSVLWVWQIPDAVDTVVCAPDDGWWYRPKHVEQYPDINKLCNVVSYWIYIGILLAHPVVYISKKRVNRNKAMVCAPCCLHGAVPFCVSVHNYVSVTLLEATPGLNKH